LSGWSGISLSRMKGSVLVIAADSLHVGNLCDMLRRAGYRVEAASVPWTGACIPVGTQAVLLVGSRPDWRIEQICVICTAIRNVAPRLPVIVVGPNDVEAKVKLFELGADDYVVEPFDRTEFLARIDSFIRRLGADSS
jgi:DNA-binding response OmpR family regulator